VLSIRGSAAGRCTLTTADRQGSARCRRPSTLTVGGGSVAAAAAYRSKNNNKGNQTTVEVETDLRIGNFFERMIRADSKGGLGVRRQCDAGV